MELTDDEFVSLAKMVGFLQVVDNDPWNAKVIQVKKAKEIREMFRFTYRAVSDGLVLSMLAEDDINEDAKMDGLRFIREKSWKNWRKVRRYL